METTTIQISKDLHKQLTLFKIKTNSKNINDVLIWAIEKLGQELKEFNYIYYSAGTGEYVKDALYQQQKNKCKRCKKVFKKDDLNIDHLKPRALGGSDYGTNLQLLCYKCHYIKTKEDLRKIWKGRKNGKI